MIAFESTLEKFGHKGEKTGWIYISVPFEVAFLIKPNCKKTYRVKGTIDNTPIKSIAMLPLAEGHFIIATNASMRKALQKNVGQVVSLSLTEDDDEVKLSADLLLCMEEDADAKAYFDSLPPSQKLYYSNWVKAAKSPVVIANRIAHIIQACSAKENFGQMMRRLKLVN